MILKRRPVNHATECEGADAVLSAVVCENGALQYCEFCYECGQRSSSYGKRELLAAGVDLAAVLVVKDYRSQPCEVCGKLGVELHHFACQTHDRRFREPGKWPTPWLCRTCHAEWHRIITPDLVAGNVTLGELGARRSMTLRELTDRARDFISNSLEDWFEQEPSENASRQDEPESEAA